ncbi:MAG: AMP-binding protein, partial [Planctomycetes bacterium]|nr:AMP-binding protein [Planctomycetota bacterium]
MNLIECFSPSLHGRAEKVALTFDDREFTFGDFNDASTITANALKDRYDIQKGDRIAMFLENCPELIIWYLACLKLGVIIVPMNVLYRDRELSHLMTDAEPRLLFTDQDRYEVIAPLLSGFDSLEKVITTDIATDIEGTVSWADLHSEPNNTAVDYSGIIGDDAAMMIYTSGTTGTSKGALLSHHNLVSNIISLVHCWQWTEQDKFVLSLPLFHLHGLGNGLHGWMTSGCHVTLFRRFKAEVILDCIRNTEATLFFGVPTMYERFLEAIENGEEKPTSLRLLVSGSAPLSPETFVQIEKVFGYKILERYGMSETAMITSNLYDGPNSRVQGTVGKPLPGVSLRIANADNTVVESGEVGEVQIQGPNVLKCYWRQPEKTKEAYTEDGWFKTG